MPEWVTMLIVWALGIVIGFFACVIYENTKKKKPYDGVISLEHVDDEEIGDGMFMSLNIGFDQLVNRKDLTFELQNKLSQN